ncbi:hypothetical protein [Marinifilum breve]|nr:hypothetical protein [Marinifilum breve]
MKNLNLFEQCALEQNEMSNVKGGVNETDKAATSDNNDGNDGDVIIWQ